MSYTPTVWKTGDVITAEKLNKLEQGVQNEQVGPPGADGAPGADGKDGAPGADGAPGRDATINGQNAVQIVAGDNVSIDQSEPGVLKISATGGGGGGIPLESIEITTPPNKTEYTAGEVFDNTGMVITAKYGFGLSQEVSGYTVSPSGELTGDVTEITISYSEGGVTKTVTQPVTVARLNATITIDPKTVSLDADTQTAQVSVEYTGDGEVTAQSGNPELVSASLEEGTLTVTSLAETSETVKITVRAQQTGKYNAASAELSVSNYVSSQIYGALWDGSASTAWSRTDAAELFPDPEPAVNNGTGSSPFDDIMPWAGMTRVSDPVAGELVQIPKFWYKWTRSGASMQLQIANSAVEGFHVSPAHADRGDGQGERDVVYVGRYHCDSSYKSTTGVQPLGNITRATARDSISALGAEYWQYDFAMYWTIAMLYLVEFANWNSQEKIGYGCSPSGSIFNMGLTDDMKYHTGTSAENRTTYGCCQYRNIEGLWDNLTYFVDGIYFSDVNIYCINNPSKFSDSTNGTYIGNKSNSSGYVSKFIDSNVTGFEYAIYCSETLGNENTYVCDYVVYASASVLLRAGGGPSKSNQYGIFYMSGGSKTSANSSIGSRLMKLPNKA